MPRGDLAGVLERIDWPAGALCWARWPLAARLGDPSDMPGKLGDSTQGRIFWEEGELRWQRLREGVRLVYLGEGELPLDGFESRQLEMEASRDLDLVLENRHVWDEAALPSAGPGRLLCVQVREYRSAELGEFSRFVGLAARNPADLEPSGEVPHA
jgi:hypothetical protein